MEEVALKLRHSTEDVKDETTAAGGRFICLNKQLPRFSNSLLESIFNHWLVCSILQISNMLDSFTKGLSCGLHIESFCQYLARTGLCKERVKKPAILEEDYY